MKMAYITTYDPTDIHVWSGTIYHILHSLKNVGIQIEPVGNFRGRKIVQLTSTFKKIYYSKVQSKKYLEDRDPFFIEQYSRAIEDQLNTFQHDIVFSPGTLALSQLTTKKPIVFWADASFSGMIDYYDNYKNLCHRSLQDGHKIEQSVLSICHLAIYASDWAANSAIQNYDVDPEKVKVVPFGANISCDRKIEDIKKIIENKDRHVCKLLFVGADWDRKGGKEAVRITEILNQRGIKAELNVVGCRPDGQLPEFIKIHGFLSKRSNDGVKFLEKLFRESHFFILPSHAECFGIVFAEASSFGLPSLASKSGGITTAIKEGKNGFTFSLGDSLENYCDCIEEIMSSKDAYRNLAMSSFTEYTNRLNWTSAGKNVYDLLIKYCI